MASVSVSVSPAASALPLSGHHEPQPSESSHHDAGNPRSPCRGSEDIARNFDAVATENDADLPLQAEARASVETPPASASEIPLIGDDQAVDAVATVTSSGPHLLTRPPTSALLPENGDVPLPPSVVKAEIDGLPPPSQEGVASPDQPEAAAASPTVAVEKADASTTAATLEAPSLEEAPPQPLQQTDADASQPVPQPAAQEDATAAADAPAAAAKLKLWEREALEASRIEEMRRLRIAELDEHRSSEAAEAARRQEQNRQLEDVRAAEEEERRQQSEIEKQETLLRLSEENSRYREELEQQMAAEQAALKQERLRQEQIRQEREAPKLILGDADDFNYNLQEGMAKKIKAFRQRGSGGDTLIMKIEHSLNELQIEESLQKLSLEELADRLEDFALAGQPRYVLHIYRFQHADGRVAFPIAFLMLMPENIPIHLKVLYTRPLAGLCETFSVNKHFALDDPESLDAEWLEVKLGLRSA